MVLIVPDEIKKLEAIYKPFLDGCKIKSDAPEKAKEAYEKACKWYNESQDDWEQ